MSLDAFLIDVGTGNLHSVYNALHSLGFNILVTSNPEDLLPGGRMILPGVGAFGNFMAGLRRLQLEDVLKKSYQNGCPFLGICVGMQALFEISTEMGPHSGFGLLAGQVSHFPDFQALKVPHTGWNQLWFKAASPLLANIKTGDYAYFNHSYYCQPTCAGDVTAVTDYGLEFASIIQHENLYGVQFHPEKSQRVGLQILANFMKL